MRKLTNEEWIHRAKQIHGDRYDYSNTIYTNTRTKVKIRCRIHGLFEQLPFDHTIGHGCPKCGFELPRNKDWRGYKYLKRVEGVGINDIPFSKRNDSYLTWHNMLRICYNNSVHKKQPMYIDCKVCDEWLTFSNFKKWFDNPENGYREGYQLDKDIIFKGNKIYSPKTCCFVPQAINCLFGFNSKKNSKLPTGVYYHHGKIESIINCYGKNKSLGTFDTVEEAFLSYKIAKELYIKEVATSYYNRGEITKKVYDALLKYEVGLKG